MVVGRGERRGCMGVLECHTEVSRPFINEHQGTRRIRKLHHSDHKCMCVSYELFVSALVHNLVLDMSVC